MTKLIETDEEVEKAMIPGGSRAGLKRLRLGYDALVARSDAGNSKLGDGRRVGRINAAGAYLASRKRGRKRVVDAGGSKVKGPRRSGVYKSTDAPSALEALDSAIEKARGLLPKGGSKRMVRVVGREAPKRHKGTHVTRLKNYIGDRADGVKAVRGYGGPTWGRFARTVTPRAKRK